MIKTILTCEHASNAVPERYQHLFSYSDDILQTHRGYDLGAAELSEHLSNTISAPLFLGTITRLLIDLNRSPDNNKSLFSKYSKHLSKLEKKHIFDTYYLQHRNSSEGRIKQWLEEQATVLHISIHSFTPVLYGKKRNCDIGLLYDPTRVIEKNTCRHLKKILKQTRTDLRLRSNYPYKGTADGFIPYLRSKFSKNYIGIEIEVNQSLVERKKLWEQVKLSLSHSIREIINKLQKT